MGRSETYVPGRIVRIAATLFASLATIGALTGAPPLAMAASESTSGPLSTTSLLGGAAEALTPGGAQLAAEAKRVSPEALRARSASQTEYEGISAQAAGHLAGSVFPDLVDRPAAGPPGLAAGERVAKYIGPDAASVVLPDGHKGVIEGLGSPMAMPKGAHGWTPIDMSLKGVAGGYAATSAPAGLTVQVPKRLGEGVSLPMSGVSLTPVDSQDNALPAAEGTVDGASVFFSGAEAPSAGVKDMAVLVKPGVESFEVSDVLLSAESPEALFFRVGMPSGARLVQAQPGSGAAEVIDEGAVIARVQAPQASDAEGKPVPVTMSTSGHLLTLTVPHPEGVYTLPIAVDPTATGVGFADTYYGVHYKTRWRFYSNGPGFTAPATPEEPSWTEQIASGHGGSEWGDLEYTTQGESEIVSARIEGRWNDTGANVENFLNLYTHAGPESRHVLPVNTEERYAEVFNSYSVCAPAEKCEETEAVGSAGPENKAEYLVEASAAGGSAVSNILDAGYATVSQEKSPEVEFNTWSPTVRESDGEYVPNALYGGKGWLSPHTAFEVHAKDPGMGISYYRLLSVYAGEERLLAVLGG